MAGPIALIERCMVDWDAIVAREGPGVWRTAYRLLGNHADAEDCFQETFLSAFALSRQESFVHPKALLHRLTTARALDRLRRRYRNARRENGILELNGPPAQGAGPSQLAEAAELSERLRAALAMLPAKQAEAFCLFYLDGWDYARMAPHLDSSVNGVGVLLHRARHKLRQILAEVPQPEPAQRRESHE
jgi:RNA polymerase sigma-70 factor (ECF subfamily)